MHLLHFPSLKCYTIIKHTQPKEEKMQYTKEIFAYYTKEYIRIYQAYNTTIAHEAVKELPVEKIYEIKDKKIRNRLGM